MTQPVAALQPFDAPALQRLAEDMAWAGAGAQLTQAQVDRLIGRWQAVVRPLPKHQEPFDLADQNGETTGIVAPRWLCHLLGLGHRTVHLALATPQDWLVLQVRSRHVDWPGRIDLAVTGHVRAGLSWEEAIQREAQEELGLNVRLDANMLAPPGFTQVDTFIRHESDSENPPVHILHVTRLYAARLTAAGLAGLRFSDGEVSALYLCSPAEASRLIVEEPHRVAPGLAQSLPRYLAWASGDTR